jgi:hypothetical protein
VVDDGVAWSCIQAFAGFGNDPDKAEAARNVAPGRGLRVVCTPSGGARSVALELPEGWEESMSDAQLLTAIRNGLQDASTPR